VVRDCPSTGATFGITYGTHEANLLDPETSDSQEYRRSGRVHSNIAETIYYARTAEFSLRLTYMVHTG